MFIKYANAPSIAILLSQIPYQFHKKDCINIFDTASNY